MTYKANNINGSIWIEKNGIKYFGKGPLELLKGIELTGSINEAAKQMELSYKKAWTIIQRINEVTGKEMITTQSGGKRGGGATISKEAKDLMNKYEKLVIKFQSFMEKESKTI
jgi:molybdate transport system regulatory protein